jgi:hypothetical protein
LHSVGSVVLHLFIIFVVGSCGTQEYKPEHNTEINPFSF